MRGFWFRSIEDLSVGQRATALKQLRVSFLRSQSRIVCRISFSPFLCSKRTLSICVYAGTGGGGGRGPFLYSCINLRVSYALCDDGKNRRLGYLVFSESVSANSDRHCSSILPLKSTNVTIWQSVGYFASLFSFNNNNNNNNNNSLFMYQII